jgi:hypothetical protein
MRLLDFRELYHACWGVSMLGLTETPPKRWFRQGAGCYNLGLVLVS